MREAVTVIAVTYSPGGSLRTFIESLHSATSLTPELILVDNGTTDGSVEEACRDDNVRLVRSGSNLGYGTAANVGMGQSLTDFVVIANPDVLWHSGAIDELLDAANRWPDGGTFGPLVTTGRGEIYPSARTRPSLRNGIGHAVFGWCWPTNPWTRRYRAEDIEPSEREAGWLSGCCLLVRRTAFEEIGGFDPAYFMYFEDLDLGERMNAVGWKNVYVPSAVVTHSRAHATSMHAAQMSREHHRSAWRYISRRYSGRRWWLVRITLRMGLATRAMLARRFPRVAEGAGAQRQWLGEPVQRS